MAYTEIEVPFKVRKRVRKRYKYNLARGGRVTMADENTGEVNNYIRVDESDYYVDVTAFCKVYDVSILMLLSLVGLRVLFYIMHAMEYKETVVVDLKKCMEFTGYKTVSTIYSALRELEGLDIIKKKTRLEYFVNPNVIYKGDRSKYGKRSIIKEIEEG